MRLVSLFLVVLTLRLTTAAAQGVSLSKPGCQEKCGNVVVPYPFGIGQNCSAGEPFTIICNETLNPPRAFFLMVGIGFEQVVEISLATKTVTVMHTVSPLNCSREGDMLQLGRPVTELSFATFSSIHNRVVVVGCQNVVSLLPSYGECNPICGISDICNGVNCCQNLIPPGKREFEFRYRNPEVSSADALSCGYVFMTDHTWLLTEYKNYPALHNFTTPSPLRLSPELLVPLVLEWEFNVTVLEGVKCETRGDPFCLIDNSTMSIYRCSCDSGFEGNPYLPGGGCQDIDECSSGNFTNCRVGTVCVNTYGSFTCRVADESNVKKVVIGISCGIGALVLLGVGWMLFRVARKRIKENRKKMFFKRNGGLLLEQQLSSSDGGVEKIKFFYSEELALATDCYNENRILGRGGQGTVYKGMLHDGRIVAVKKSKKMNESDIRVFVNEVVILSQINHRNIVKLLGCCLETEVPLLVYEFIPNGTLFEHIHDPNNEFPLLWKMRLRIATEIAGALAYLHSAASVPIYHRDIKSTNILLDEKYRAKVSDFGTSKSFDIDQTHVTTRVMGTFGYMDPEYFRSNQLTEKSDVYSFGVVLVELLTGEKAIIKDKDEGVRSLVAHFMHLMEENKLFELLDPEVVREGGAEDDTVAVARLARRCLNLDRKKRPTMKDVAVELEAIQMGKGGGGSILQSDDEEKQFLSIEIDDSSSIISDATNFNTTGEPSESPLLFRKP
ncbi:hypothetical protein C2S51_032389 [Perilla frutescens var. frutescens]|nr:hypothetical protein C2S51_032389 [Perilla frutescens var. frutescens]